MNINVLPRKNSWRWKQNRNVNTIKNILTIPSTNDMTYRCHLEEIDSGDYYGKERDGNLQERRQLVDSIDF